MFLYLAISRKTSSSEILVNTFFSFCFLLSLSSASRNSRVVCSIVNIFYPFRVDTQTNGKRLFTPFPRLLKREKGNITLSRSRPCVGILSFSRPCGGYAERFSTFPWSYTLQRVRAAMLSRYISRSYTAFGWLVSRFVSFNFRLYDSIRST